MGKVLFTLFLGALGCAHTALAEPIPGSRFPSARAGALSQAFLPLVDRSGEALFYNPAALGTLRGVQFEPVNLVLAPNNDYLQNMNRNFYRITSLNSYAKVSPGKRGSFPGAGFAFLPSISFRGFAFGVLAEGKWNALNQDGEVRYRTRIQLVPAAGFGLPLAHGIMNLGYVLQYVSKAEGENTLPVSAPNLSYGNGIREGYGISHNLGLGFKFPFKIYPSLQIVARNLGGVHYSTGGLIHYASNSPGPPKDEQTSLDVSMSIKPRLGGPNFMSFILEGRDLTGTSHTRFLRRIAIGTEFELVNRLFIRAGWGGAPSAGFAIKSRFAELHFTWTSEYYGIISEGDREAKYLLQYQIRAW